jgi:hypothetical protein
LLIFARDLEFVRVAYFTAGSAGAGHLVRGVALGRALARRGGDHSYRVFSPRSPFARVAAPWLEEVEIEPTLLRDARTADQSAVARALRAYAPDVVVIDLFWTPLVFVTLSCPSVLLLRSAPAAWLVGPSEARFDARRYARVFAIEPAPGLDRFESIDPVVVSAKSDVRSHDELRALLGQRTGALRVIARGGLPSDQERLARAAREIDPGPWTTLDLAAPEAVFPAAEWLAAMREGDRLVACPGYNLYWEARALGFDAHTTWVPIARKLDDPFMRAALRGPAPSGNGADQLARVLSDLC